MSVPEDSSVIGLWLVLRLFTELNDVPDFLATRNVSVLNVCVKFQFDSSNLYHFMIRKPMAMSITFAASVTL